jgi:uncharacterized Zn finger protein (UPF0148 family)
MSEKYNYICPAEEHNYPQMLEVGKNGNLFCPACEREYELIGDVWGQDYSIIEVEKPDAEL